MTEELWHVTEVATGEEVVQIKADTKVGETLEEEVEETPIIITIQYISLPGVVTRIMLTTTEDMSTDQALGTAIKTGEPTEAGAGAAGATTTEEASVCMLLFTLSLIFGQSGSDTMFSC
jgi:hypothetical protein